METEITISGIYFLLKNKELVYIGQSKNLNRRLKYHSFDFDEYYSIECLEEDLNSNEKYLIELVLPNLNIIYNKQNKPKPSIKGSDYKIKKVADRVGLSMLYISKKTEISPSQLSKINSGKSSVTLEQIKKIADALDVRFVELIELPEGYGYTTDSDRKINGIIYLKSIKTE